MGRNLKFKQKVTPLASGHQHMQGEPISRASSSPTLFSDTDNWQKGTHFSSVSCVG